MLRPTRPGGSARVPLSSRRVTSLLSAGYTENGVRHVLAASAGVGHERGPQLLAPGGPLVTPVLAAEAFLPLRGRVLSAWHTTAPEAVALSS